VSRRYRHKLGKNQRIRLGLLQLAGARCERCGYDRCLTALQFHHRKPHKKKFTLSGKGLRRPLPEILREMRKCALLCANCHAEVHELFDRDWIE